MSRDKLGLSHPDLLENVKDFNSKLVFNYQPVPDIELSQEVCFQDKANNNGASEKEQNPKITFSRIVRSQENSPRGILLNQKKFLLERYGPSALYTFQSKNFNIYRFFLLS
jgi:hypothetical protein